jgi:hypothetical protein
VAALSSASGNTYSHVIKGIGFFTRLCSQNDIRRRVTKEGYIVGTVFGILEQIAAIESYFSLRVHNIHYLHAISTTYFESSGGGQANLYCLVPHPVLGQIAELLHNVSQLDANEIPNDYGTTFLDSDPYRLSAKGA